jgi:hypothetical protein
VTVELTWSETLALVGGSGKAVVWTKVSYARSAGGPTELTMRPCGLHIPDVTTSALGGGLKAGFVPITAFDAGTMLPNLVTSAQSDGRGLTFAASLVVGTMLTDPAGPWPSSANLEPFDHDGDESPGITARPLEGPGYAAPPTSIANLETLDRAYMAMRAGLRVSITPACSGITDGKVEPFGFNVSIIGCHVKDRDACTASELRFVANGMPRFMLGTSGTWTEVEIPKDASCADVRAALPAPTLAN